MCKWKRMCSAILLCLVLVTLLPIPAMGSAEDMGSGFSWSFQATTGILTITGSGAMPHFKSYGERPWDKYENIITKVVISKGVTSIGEYAFYNMDALVTVELPEGLVSIQKSAFSGCDALTTIKLPGTLSTIGASAFSNCENLSEIVLPESLKFVGEYAFDEYNNDTVTRLHIPAAVNTIGEGAFSGRNLTNITVDPKNTSYYTDAQGVLYSRFPKAVVKAPAKMEGTYTIASGTTKVLKYAFENVSSLKEIIIPASVTTLESYAFEKTSVEKILIPDTVTTIESSVFYYGAVTEVILPQNLKAIPNYMFYGTYRLKDLTIPDSVETIGNNAFTYSNLESVIIPEGVIDIKDSAFSDMSVLKKVHIPASVTSIEGNAFVGGSKEMVFTVAPDNKFYSVSDEGMLTNKSGTTIICAPESITGTLVISPKVELIGANAFETSPLKVIAIIGKSFTIESNAFYYAHVEKLYLGAGLKYIDGDQYNNPFNHTNELTDIYFGGTEEQWKAALPEKLKEFPEEITIHYEVSYENFRKELQLETMEPAITLKSCWEYVIIAAAVVLPGLYILIAFGIKKKKKEGA